MPKSELSPVAAPAIKQADVSALSALFLGTANEDQQKLAREWILLHACRMNSTTFDANPVISAFLQGRRQVGLMILNAARTSAKGAQALEELNTKDNEHA